ncbi:MAG: Ig-like domain-containing protein [Clostridia bacterium]|nr:Ig-like domain-containing protein [Clostridia bacterium]
MKRLISLICLFTLVFAISAPMQFASAADEVVEVGADSITIGGITYNKTGMYFDKRGFDSGDGLDYSYMKLNAEIHHDIGDYATLTGKDDTDGHGNVFVYYGDTIDKNINLTTGGDMKGGALIFAYDICYTGGVTEGNDHNFWTYGSVTNGFSQLSYFSVKKYDDQYKYVLKNANDEFIELYTISPNEWHNVAIMIDFDSNMFTVFIDGVPKAVRVPWKIATANNDIEGINRSETTVRAAADAAVIYDNLVGYKYAQEYNVNAVKGVATDGITLTEKALYANGSKIAVQFDTTMMTTAMEDNVELALKGGKKVKIKEILAEDYDTSTNTLYITAEEALKPNSVYEITLKSVVIDDEGKRLSGVVTTNGIGYDENTVVEITTDVPEYGAEVSIPVTLTAGSTANVTVDIRGAASSVESDLVLALYVDGKLRDISSASIPAGTAAANYPFTIDVPADGNNYKLCAMIIGTNYEIIDVIDVPIAE